MGQEGEPGEARENLEANRALTASLADGPATSAAAAGSSEVGNVAEQRDYTVIFDDDSEEESEEDEDYVPAVCVTPRKKKVASSKEPEKKKRKPEKKKAAKVVQEPVEVDLELESLILDAEFIVPLVETVLVKDEGWNSNIGSLSLTVDVSSTDKKVPNR